MYRIINNMTGKPRFLPSVLTRNESRHSIRSELLFDVKQLSTYHSSIKKSGIGQYYWRKKSLLISPSLVSLPRDP
ncbi:hypothetical protein RRG08_054449 [Elysia crispata]|uniref:Uncharacterized protein n=1 Tax=Elysia crispata TaxID=231223 RepID=A0AAE1AVK6_9GAST|nr:hypothetical protein RRG08_054449 [Elysia crispata]